jgi:NAD(P)-dependent dehydrogenase (short-subunit alcohol dehydrogenase family)
VSLYIIRVKSSLEKISILLTGATGGIGIATARALSENGAELLIHGRDRQKVDKLTAELISAGSKARGFVADLSSLAETARLARQVLQSAGTLDVLINNAGVGFGRDGKKREVSRDGHELRFAVNYLAPFLFTEELLGAGLPRRAVINVASAGQDTVDLSDLMTGSGYSGVRAYCRSKLALIMMTFDCAALHPGLQVHALHPGTYLDSHMVREAGIQPLGPVSQGADSILAVLDAALDAAAPRGESGRYFDRARPARALAQAYQPQFRRKLREASLSLVAPFRG